MITVTRRITNKSEDKFKLEVTCDMSELTPEQIEEYAFDAIWIREQAKMRDLTTKALEGMTGEYTFTAEAKGNKAPKDPVKSAIKAVPNMTKKQREEMLKAIDAAEALEKEALEKEANK